MAIQDTSSQSNRQHAVPQNIMDVEFKIIGDLTMRQFSYLFILGILAYFNSQFMVGIFKWPLTLFFVLLGLALAFIPVQDRGMDVWLVNFMKSVYKPTQRVWKKAAAVPSAFLYDNLNVVKQELITLAPTSSRRKLEEFLDYSTKHLPKDPLDIPEEEYIRKAYELSRGSRPVSTATISISPIIETPVSPKPVSAVLTTPTTPQPVIKVPVQEKPLVEEPPIISKKPEITTPKVETLIPPISKKEETKQEVSITPLIKEEPKVVPPVTTTPPSIPDKTLVEKEEAPVVTITPVVPPIVTPSPVSAARRGEVPYIPITPDRHSGRRFTSFLPSQGELVLPIRGERVLKTSEQVDFEEDLEEKTEKLQELLAQIRQSNIKPIRKVSTSPEVGLEDTSSRAASPSVSSSIPKMVPSSTNLDEVTKKRSALMNDLNNLRNSRDVSASSKAQSLQKELKRVDSELSAIKGRVEDTVKPVETLSTSSVSGTTIKDASEVAAKGAPSLDKANVLWGFVKDPSGKPLSDIVVLIKNVRGEPVRATKTNELGQFLLTTPLNNGKYIADISSTNKSGFVFDAVSLEASGNVIPPIDFIGK